MATRFILRSSALVFAATVAAALSGCATSLSSTSSPATPVSLAAGQIGGRLHGGNQPVTGATVTLWAAGAPTASGSGSYGKGATSLATTTTDVNGNFTFNNASGASPCTAGQYLYVTAVGGNTGAGTNPYSAMLAALPTPCVTGAAGTGATFIWINEVTTVAAVTALQQFMSINPAALGTTPAWQIGAPASNVSGLANAFAETSQLAAIATGVSQAVAVTNTVAGVTYTNTVSPDNSRINTLADILSACVNTPGTSACTSLFSDVTPSGSTAPGDTIQAMYYLATNPAGLTMNAHSAANSPTYLCNTYVTAAAPFLPDLVCGTNTNDWVIGVKWQNVNNAATPATVGTLAAASVALDAAGNIWVGAGSGTTSASGFVNEFNHFGQTLLNPVTTANIAGYNQNYVVAGVTTTSAFPATSVALGYSRAFGLAIDTLGNAWFDSFGTTSPGTLSNGLISGVIAEVAPTNQTGVATGYIVGSSNGALAIDGSNNIYMSTIPTTGRYYLSELPSSTNYQTFDEGLGRSTGIYNYVFVDDTLSQYAWGFVSSTSGTGSTIVRGTTASEASGTTTASITDSAFAYYGAPDAVGNAWVTANNNLYYLFIGASITAPTVSTFTGSTTGGVGGLSFPTGVAIDGNGNVWVYNRPSGTLVGGVSAFVPTVSNGTATVTPLSPAVANGFQADGDTSGMGLQIDTSGNLWINNSGGSAMYHIVGAAAPVVTPTALAIANTTLGVKP